MEVAFALPDRQLIRTVTLEPGSCVEDAIEAAELSRDFPGLQIDPKAVGVFSRKVPMDHELREGDRVEIYRPLIADPKEVRRQQAELAKQKRSGKA